MTFIKNFYTRTAFSRSLAAPEDFMFQPIGDKHLVVSFSQELVGQEYTLPLRGLPKIERVDVQLGAMQLDGTNQDQVLTRRNWRPERDFVATVPVSATAVTSGTLVAGTIALDDKQGDLGPPQPPKRITLLIVGPTNGCWSSLLPHPTALALS